MRRGGEGQGEGERNGVWSGADGEEEGVKGLLHIAMTGCHQSP
jgi:hypothetical protein